MKNVFGDQALVFLRLSSLRIRLVGLKVRTMLVGIYMSNSSCIVRLIAVFMNGAAEAAVAFIGKPEAVVSPSEHRYYSILTMRIKVV